MAFQRPSLADLITRTTADLVSRLELVSPVLRRAFVRVLAKVWSGLTHSLHGHLDWAARQLFASTAESAELDKHGAELSLPRKAAAYAGGDYTFSGTDASVIPAGTRLQRSDGVEYSTDAEATIAGGTATVAITAITAGVDGDADAATQLTLVSPIAGVQSAGVVAAGGLTGGLDTESDANYRTRILERKRNTPQGGAANDYIRWAKEVPGVTRVWIRPQWMGAGTVGVTFVVDDSDPIIPDAAKVTEVQDYIDDPSRRPVTAEVIVFAPAALAVDHTITLTPNTAAVRAAVQAELEDLYRRIGEPGVAIALSQISEAISIAPGETSHVLVAPAADVTPAANQLPTLGGITWL